MNTRTPIMPYLRYCPKCRHYQIETSVCKKFSFNVSDYPKQFLKRCQGEGFEAIDAGVAPEAVQPFARKRVPRNKPVSEIPSELEDALKGSQTFTARAIMATVLMFGFYTLAVAIAAGLLFIPFAQIFYGDGISIRLSLFCLVVAFSILAAIWPRGEEFLAPGPALTQENEPKLFKHLEDIARKTGQSMPEEVYLLSEMNAWVANRGGTMGYGSWRVMGLGLPLMAVISEAEFDAILAHEFGHYCGGDTRLGPWVYKTRTAIGRTLINLGDGIMSLPFRTYGRFFLRITQKISRGQEYTADRVAAFVSSARALIGGLETLHAKGQFFDVYWQNELGPLAEVGIAPPIMDGFHRFLSAPAIKLEMSKLAEQEKDESEDNRYDSHPLLHDRIEALKELIDEQVTAPVTEKAIDLLSNPEAAERDLFTFVAATGGVYELRVISWDAVLTEAYLPRWKQMTGSIASLLGQATIDMLPEVITDQGREIARAITPEYSRVPDEDVLRVIFMHLGASLTLAMIDFEWDVRSGVGEPIRLHKGEQGITPFELLAELVSGRLSEVEWRQMIGKYKIGQIPLVSQSTRDYINQ